MELMEDKSVAVVATKWLSVSSDHDVCCWPPTSKVNAVEKLVKDRVQLASDWVKYSVRVLHRYGCLLFIF